LKPAEQLVEELAANGGSAEATCFDVTDVSRVNQELDNLIASGPISVLVSNAGIHDDAPMAGMSIEQWQSVINVSLNGFFNVCKPLLLPMIRERWGRVIAVSSVAGQLGNRGQSNYAAAKSGLHGAIKSLSLELASRGITANAVAPGIIKGRLTESLFSQEQLEQLVPAKREGSPEDGANLIAFLASDKADYITGQVIGVNGGMT